MAKKTGLYLKWEGCGADDTSKEPAKRFGTELPLHRVVGRIFQMPF